MASVHLLLHYRLKMNNLEILDILTIISFALQIDNQNRIIDIKDVQGEVNRAIDEIHKHLEIQDKKLDTIIKGLKQ